MELVEGETLAERRGYNCQLPTANYPVDEWAGA
jgi:hypothetical protein